MIQPTNIKKTNREITKKLTTIENSLKRKLNAFYNSNIKGNISPIEVLKGRYESQVRNMIRSTVQDAYFTGTKIVTDQITKINDNFEVFISTTDIANISNLSNKLSDQFWKTAGRLHRREQEFIVLPTGYEIKPQFDIIAAMIGFAVSAAYLPFNNAIISKMQILNEPIELQSGLLLQTGFDTPLTGKIMFLTQEDASVDPDICEPLNRTVYDADDPLIPIPIEDTHLHCRCRLVPIVDETESLF